MSRFAGMTKILLMICIVCSCYCGNATTYYFSTSRGDDSRSALAATSSLTPWKTINKLNSFFSNIKAGDSILFKAGESYFGSILITKSGSSQADIYLGSYGTGDKPVITGFTPVTSWTSTGKGVIFESPALNAKNGVSVVTINDELIPMGRFPNESDSNSGYLTFTSHVGQTSISSKQIANITSFVGGQVVIRPQRDILDKCTVTQQTATTVTYQKVSSFVPQDGAGFFFQNHINTLNRFGEWYFNRSTKKMSVFFGAFSPSNYDIKIAVLDTLLRAQSRQYVTIENLSFQGANIRAVYLLGGSQIRIRSCTFRFCYDAIFTQGSVSDLINQCTFSDCTNNGVRFNSKDNHTSTTLSNCSISNIAIHAGMGESGSGNYEGINMQGGYNKILNNTVDTIGHMGIHFSAGDSCLVQNNYVAHFCKVKNDGGGIYTWNDATDGSGNSTATTYYGNRVIGNIVVDAYNADDGTTWGVAKGVYGAQGLYMDGNSENIEVAYNTVSNCGKGIFLHDNRNMYVHDNVSYNNNEEQLDAILDANGLKLKPVRGLRIIHNIFYSANPSQRIMHISTFYNDIAQFGTFDSNYYGQSFKDKNLIAAEWVSNKVKYSQVYNLEGWQLTYNKDSASVMTSKYIHEYITSGLTGSNKYPSGDYEDPKMPGTLCLNSGRTCVATWVQGVLTGGCYRLSYKAVGSSTNVIIQDVGALDPTKKYILNYTLLGTKNASTVGIYLRDKALLKPLVTTQYITYGTTKMNGELLFTPTSSASTGQIIFKFNDRDSSIYLDNITLYEALVSPTNAYEWLNFEYNGTGRDKVIPISSDFWSADNNPYSTPVTLTPYSSIILINLANAGKRLNK
jgi:hypothetical protein